MKRSDCYTLLGLSPDATRSEIRKQYRMLALRYHPDKNPDPHAGELFIKLTEAYETLINKRAEEEEQVIGNSRRPKAAYEERIKTAKERFAEQKIRENEENERYFNYLTRSRRWKTIRAAAILGTFLSVLLILDLFLPHHYSPDEITHYRLDVGLSPTGKSLGVVQTKGNDSYFLSQMKYDLYNRHRNILVESSWLFHNPIRVVSLGKIDRQSFEIHFSTYSVTWFLLIALNLPIFAIYFKRKHVFYTILYHASYFGTSALIIYLLLTGSRWAHVLTLGFL